MQTTDLYQAINDRKLSGRDLAFAIDLCAAERKYGRLTPKQEPWVGRLLERANGVEPERPTRELGDVSALVELFNRPRLKYPKIHLQTSEGDPVVLYRAGERSSHPGSIAITDGRPYGEGKWYGRILTSGVWQQPSEPSTSRAASAVPAEVVAVVEALAKTPAETAAAHGHLTGRCCFCSLPLTDERSTAVGYGKTCAGHYGLPWGTV